MSAEHGQTPGTRKNFTYSKQSLIAEKYIFWIYKRGIVSGEVASIFENIEMYVKVVNIPLPSSGINTFVLKWYMTRVPGGIPLK